MKIQGENYSLFASLVEKAGNIVIFVRSNPDIDTLAAALALEKALSLANKKIRVVARGNLPLGLAGRDKIKDKLEPKKLVISFNWHKNQVEKVSYNLEGENFNFIVTPRNGEIAKNELKIDNRGLDPDLIITLGLSSLGSLFENERELSQQAPIVNIDRGSNNELFGRLNFVKETDSLCALAAALIENGRLPVEPVVAGFLMTGIRAATENFDRVLDPATFEAAAFCAKLKSSSGIDKAGPEVTAETVGEKEPSVPKDWLAPKVFRSKQAS